MLKKKTMRVVAISGFFALGLFAVLAYSGPAWSGPTTKAPTLDGSYLVRASGTAYFPYIGDPPTGIGSNPQQAVHFTMAGSATFKNGVNTAVNLTLNLGGLSTYEGTSSFWSYSGNDVVCYFTTPGDLVYTPPSASTTPPNTAMLTVKPTVDTGCGQPSGEHVNSEKGKVIPFNFYPDESGGVIVSNYTYTTAGGTTPGNYPNGFIDAYGNTAYDFSATGKLTPISTSTSIFVNFPK